MKLLVMVLTTLIINCGLVCPVDADVSVRDYYRKNGTYVKSHMRSNPDGNFWNNWSTWPNINPYTRARGTKRTPPYSGVYMWRYGNGIIRQPVYFSNPGRERRIAQEKKAAQAKEKARAPLIAKQIKIRAEIKVITLRIAKMKLEMMAK